MTLQKYNFSIKPQGGWAVFLFLSIFQQACHANAGMCGGEASMAAPFVFVLSS
jgi:hypothetical protein